MHKLKFTIILLLFISFSVKSQMKTDANFAIEVLSQNQNSSSCKVYFQVENNLYFIENENVPYLKDASLEENNMLTSVRGFQSGRQIEYIAVGNQSGILIKKREFDGRDSNSNFRTIKTIPYSKIPNGNKLRTKYGNPVKVEKGNSFNVTDEYFVGVWKSSNNVYVQVKGFGNNLSMKVGKGYSNGKVTDTEYDSFANFKNGKITASDPSKKITLTPVDFNTIKLTWNGKTYNETNFVKH